MVSLRIVNLAEETSYSQGLCVNPMNSGPPACFFTSVLWGRKITIIIIHKMLHQCEELTLFPNMSQLLVLQVISMLKQKWVQSLNSKKKKKSYFSLSAWYVPGPVRVWTGTKIQPHEVFTATQMHYDPYFKWRVSWGSEMKVTCRP